jgi:hypothetical protein
MAKIMTVHGKPIHELTIDELKAEDARRIAQRQESQDRCDTDGFLSQWASGLTSSVLRAQMEIAANGGTADFRVLKDASGEVVSRTIQPSAWVNGIHRNAAWIIPHNLRAKYGRGFVPYGSNSRVQKKLGLVEGHETVPAVAIIEGTGTGLSGTAVARKVRLTAELLNELVY